MTTPNAPRKRASNTERERISQLLDDAHVDGQLSLTEFDDRTKALWAATYADELPALVADLTPVEHGSGTLEPISSQPGGSALSFSIMGESVKKGRWHVAPTHTSITVMGGNDLDLRNATLSAHETVINAFAVMGGIDIIVPDDVRVIDDGIGVLGGFERRDDPSSSTSHDHLPSDAPVVRVRGLALMGGVDIIRAARDAHIS
ncbi:DUF1707 domain-containing protein [Corynebacterium sp. Q4381]|uniref:DUF1707 SHOCT-like domain-containing protein n=1 Tax=Corynebacterium sp. Marseille-Q4381 TaxID=3121597 RepID=UPI002FE62A37